jgi:hypothetical protein
MTRHHTPEVQPLLSGETFSSAEVAGETGATLRQLQWWDERHIVTVRHEGHRRFYTVEDKSLVWLLVKLRDKGFSLQSIRRVWVSISRRLREVGPDSFLVTDGKQAQIVNAILLPEVCQSFRSRVAVVKVCGTYNANGNGTKVPAGSKSKTKRI